MILEVLKTASLLLLFCCVGTIAVVLTACIVRMMVRDLWNGDVWRK